MDVVTALLYHFLHEVIYAEQLHIFSIVLGKIYKLIEALYRLKQASHVWYKTLVEFLKKLGFIRLQLDHGILMSIDKHYYIVVYVDVLFLFGSDIVCLEDVQQKLRDGFKMTDLEDIFYHPGIPFDHIDGERITFCQSIYLKGVLDRLKMPQCKPASILRDPGVANFLLLYNGNTDKETMKWYQ